MSDQFNWIFVIIAGAVILLFFFSMVQKQQSLSIAKTDASIVRQIETLISVAGSEKNTITTKDLPNIDLTFQCKKRGTTCDCVYKSGTMDRPYDDRIIYAPKKITGTQLHLWSMAWEQPFRIANFLYATNDLHQYILVTNNQPIAQDIKKILPERLPVKIVDTPNNVMNEINPSATSINVLCISSGPNSCTPPNQFSSINNQKNWIIRNSETEISYNGNTDKFVYVGIPQLLGALFSADKEMFECNTRKSFERLASIAEIQDKRITSLNTALTPAQGQTNARSSCLNFYSNSPPLGIGGSPNVFNTIKTASEILLKDISASQSTNINTIKNSKDTIKNINDKMVLNACPSIY